MVIVLVTVEANTTANESLINQITPLLGLKMSPGIHFGKKSWKLSYSPLDICRMTSDIDHLYMTSWIMQTSWQMRINRSYADCVRYLSLPTRHMKLIFFNTLMCRRNDLHFPNDLWKLTICYWYVFFLNRKPPSYPHGVSNHQRFDFISNDCQRLFQRNHLNSTIEIFKLCGEHSVCMREDFCNIHYIDNKMFVPKTFWSTKYLAIIYSIESVGAAKSILWRIILKYHLTHDNMISPLRTWLFSYSNMLIDVHSSLMNSTPRV